MADHARAGTRGSGGLSVGGGDRGAQRRRSPPPEAAPRLSANTGRDQRLVFLPVWQICSMATLQAELLRVVAHSGLAPLRLLGFEVRANGVWRYPGVRPGTDWHAHGWFTANLPELKDERLVRLRVDKPRWLHPATNRTVHTPPPGTLGVHYSGLVVVLQLFAWLDASVGLHRFDALFGALDDRPSRRTVQRWLTRFQPRALELQQHARRVVLTYRDEPRSLDMLFPGGIPPPPALRRRPWREPHRVGQLFRALAMVLGAAVAMNVPVALLVTEAWWKVEQGTGRND